MKLAVRAVLALKTNRYTRFFKYCSQAPPLLACALATHARAVRVAALEVRR